jgi:hypothetical protein
VTNRGVQRSPSVLPYTFGAPVSGGEGFRRTVIESDSLCPDGTLQGGGVALTIEAIRKQSREEQEKLTDRLAVPTAQCAGGLPASNDG